MRPQTIEIQIDRVTLEGPRMDRDRADRLRALIEEAMRERLESLKEPVESSEGGATRIDLPALPPGSPEWERRVARAAADAVVDALRGGNR